MSGRDDFVAELTVRDLARMTGLTVRAITKRCKSGACPGARLQHGQWLIPVAIPLAIMQAIAPLYRPGGSELPLPAEAARLMQNVATHQEVHAALEPHRTTERDLAQRIDAIYQALLVADDAAATAATHQADVEGEVAQLTTRVAQLEEVLGQLTAEVKRLEARGGGLVGMFRGAARPPE